MSESLPQGSSISISVGMGSALKRILLCSDIEPGSSPSYELCKLIFLYHPLGLKLIEAPIKIAQSKARKITIQNAPEDVVKAFETEWTAVKADSNICNVKSISRVYGIASITIGVVGQQSNTPLDMDKLWDQDIYFSVYDPLNTAGSLIISQDPTSPDFNKPTDVVCAGQTFHRSRAITVMNENPIYLAYTSSAFGYVGRSVFQRTLYPLKSYLRSMQADEMIVRKLGLLIAKIKAPGSIIDQVMQMAIGIKRALLQQGETDQVLSIDPEEEIETLNMMNVDGAGTYARTNILNNIATGAGMPSIIIRNETYVSGFSEGSEDAKDVATYINEFRQEMQPIYAWFDNIVQYRAWNPEFYKTIQKKYPEKYKDVSYEEAFYQWREEFTVEWPSLLIEPESEEVNVEKTKLDGIKDVLSVILPEMDPKNKATAIQWAADNISENKIMFPHELILDMDALADFHEEQAQAQKDQQSAMAQGGMGGNAGPGMPMPQPAGKKPAGGPPGGAGKAAGGANKAAGGPMQSKVGDASKKPGGNVVKLPAPSKKTEKK